MLRPQALRRPCPRGAGPGCADHGLPAPKQHPGEETTVSWNFGDIFDAIGPRLGDEPCLIHSNPGGRDRVLSWAEVDRRSNALGRALLEQGAKAGDKVAVYAYNRPEWLEATIACFKARLVPVNVNYRYRDDELHYLLDNSDSVAVLFEGTFSPNVERLSAAMPSLRTLVRIEDGGPRLEGALAYEDLVAGPCEPLAVERSADDLLILYTGGTTGMPKGVMWRQEDLFQTLGGGGDATGAGPRPRTLAEHVANVRL